LSKKNQIF